MTRPTVALTDKAGAPKKVALAIRESESLPSRLKVTFVADTEGGIAAAAFKDGDRERVKIARLPRGTEGVALCPEFRLEMN